MKRTGTIMLAVVIGALQWGGTLWAQNAGDAKRLQEENKKLQAQVEKMTAELTKLQAELKKSKDFLAQAKAVAERERARAAQQQAQMQLIMQQMMLQQGGGFGRAGGFGGMPIPFQKQLKPPPTPIQGQITNIDAKDKTLVQLNIGSKNGLKLGQKLEVMRTKPNSVYLGEVRIVELTETTAVARHVLLPGRRLRTLQAGDVVTNNMSNVKKK